MLLLTVLIVMTLGTQYCEDNYLELAIFSQVQACDGGHVRQSLRQSTECKPRPVILRLPWPNNTDVQQMSPSYIEVFRCDGACHSHRQGCVVTKKSEKQIPVMLAKCGISTGQCSKECAHVTVEEHTECGCACEMVEKDCVNDAHHFIPDLCRCVCKDSQAKRDCLDQGRTWSEHLCSCGCPVLHSCSSGSTYSNTTCSCTVEIETILVLDQRVQRSSSGSYFSLELIIIIILLLLILGMLAVIFSLISKILSCSRQLATSKTKPTKHPPLKNSNYMQLKLQSTKTERPHHPKEEDCHPQPSFSPIYRYPSMEADHIDSLPDPTCQECLYQGGGVGGIPGDEDCRTLDLGEAVRLLQNSMAK